MHHWEGWNITFQLLVSGYPSWSGGNKPCCLRCNALYSIERRQMTDCRSLSSCSHMSMWSYYNCIAELADLLVSCSLQYCQSTPSLEGRTCRCMWIIMNSTDTATSWDCALSFTWLEQRMKTAWVSVADIQHQVVVNVAASNKSSYAHDIHVRLMTTVWTMHAVYTCIQ